MIDQMSMVLTFEKIPKHRPILAIDVYVVPSREITQMWLITVRAAEIEYDPLDRWK